MASIGIDTHKASLAVSAVDELGRQLAARTFGNDPRGHAALLSWVQRQPAPRRIGIEGAGSFGAALAEVLVTTGETVVEVPAQFTDRERRSLLQRGKSDPGDALAIARLTAREPRLPALRRPGIIADLKLLVGAREQFMAERTRLVNQLHADLLVLAPGYGARLPNLTADRHQAAAARLLARRDGVRAELARGRLRRLRRLRAEAERLEQRIETLLAASGSSLPRLAGIGTLTAAKLLGEAGNVDRYRGPASFAAASGTAPVPASSGQRQRHRLNRGGNRQLNRALHTMALVQTRWDPRAQAYLERRVSEGKSRLEAIRALKWYLARVVYRTMLADARRSEVDA
ncbi:MAG: IS110 family transposase [Chloroflexi bacterium]|nr:IS110 family transposase [Chloroflexota bacterium]